MRIFRYPSETEIANGLEETVTINKSKGLVDGFVLTSQNGFPRSPFSVWRRSPSGGFCQPRFFESEEAALDCFFKAVESLRTTTLPVRKRNRRSKRSR